RTARPPRTTSPGRTFSKPSRSARTTACSTWAAAAASSCATCGKRSAARSWGSTTAATWCGSRLRSPSPGGRRTCPSATERSPPSPASRSEEHTSELQSPYDLVCRLLLEKKNKRNDTFLEQAHFYTDTIC